MLFSPLRHLFFFILFHCAECVPDSSRIRVSRSSVRPGGAALTSHIHGQSQLLLEWAEETDETDGRQHQRRAKFLNLQTPVGMRLRIFVFSHRRRDRRGFVLQHLYLCTFNAFLYLSKTCSFPCIVYIWWKPQKPLHNVPFAYFSALLSYNTWDFIIFRKVIFSKFGQCHLQCYYYYVYYKTFRILRLFWLSNKRVIYKSNMRDALTAFVWTFLRMRDVMSWVKGTAKKA